MFPVICMCLTFSVIILLIWPLIFGTALHMNEFRIMAMLTEYIVDRKKYFYLILLHVSTVNCIGAITFTATGTMILGYVIHACGIFRIAR